MFGAFYFFEKAKSRIKLKIKFKKFQGKNFYHYY
jgi:hypothetical protein